MTSAVLQPCGFFGFQKEKSGLCSKKGEKEENERRFIHVMPVSWHDHLLFGQSSSTHATCKKETCQDKKQYSRLPKKVVSFYDGVWCFVNDVFQKGSESFSSVLLSVLLLLHIHYVLTQ